MTETDELIQKQKKYRSEIHALAAANFLSALAYGGLGVAMFRDPQISEKVSTKLAVIFVGLALVFATLGVFLVLKHAWAIAVSIGFYSLFFIGSAISLNVCGLALMGACLFQGLRVLKLHFEQNEIVKELSVDQLTETFE